MYYCTVELREHVERLEEDLQNESEPPLNGYTTEHWFEAPTCTTFFENVIRLLDSDGSTIDYEDGEADTHCDIHTESQVIWVEAGTMFQGEIPWFLCNSEHWNREGDRVELGTNHSSHHWPILFANENDRTNHRTGQIAKSTTHTGWGS